MNFVLTLITLLFFNFFAQAETVVLPAEYIRSGCVNTPASKLPKGVVFACDQPGRLSITTNKDLTLVGEVLSVKSIYVRANSLKLAKNSNLVVTGFYAEGVNGVTIVGKISALETKLYSRGNINVKGVVSSKHKTTIKGNKVELEGVVSGHRGVEVDTLSMRAQGLGKDKSQIVSEKGLVRLGSKDFTSLSKFLILGRKVVFLSGRFDCARASIVTEEALKIHTLGLEPDRQEIKINRCKLIRNNNVPSIFDEFVYFKDSNLGESSVINDDDFIENDTELLSAGNINLTRARILSPDKKITIIGKKVTMNERTLVGSNSAYAEPNIKLIAEGQSLNAYVFGHDISIVQHKQNEIFENLGFVSGVDINIDAQGVANHGVIYSRDKLIVDQKEREGACVNQGLLYSANLITHCRGEVDFKEGQRVGVRSIREIYPRDFDLTQSGKWSTHKLETTGNLTIEAIHHYAEQVKNSQIGLSMLDMSDNSGDPEKVIEFNRSILLLAGMKVKAPNIRVAENIALQAGEAGLTLEAEVGDLTLKHSSTLESKGQVVLIAGNNIIRRARIKELGPDVEVERSTIFAGSEGVVLKAKGDYMDQSSVIETPGVVTFDVAGAVLIHHLEHRFDATKVIHQNAFGKRVRHYGHVKFYGADWKTKRVQGLEKSEEVHAVNFMLNDKKFKISEEDRAHLDPEKFNFTHVEDVYYSQEVYSPSMAAYLVKGVVTAVATTFTGPYAAAAAAAANTATQPLLTGEDLTLDQAIKGFAINLAANQVNAEYAKHNEWGGKIAEALAKDAGGVVLEGKSYSWDDLLASIANGYLGEKVIDPEFAKEILIVQKYYENLIYKSINDLIYHKSIEFNPEFFEDVGLATLESMAYDYTLQSIENIKKKGQSSPGDIAQTLDPELQWQAEVYKSLTKEQQQKLIEQSIGYLDSALEEVAQELYQTSFSQLSESEKNDTLFKAVLENKIQNHLSGENLLAANSLPVNGHKRDLGVWENMPTLPFESDLVADPTRSMKNHFSMMTLFYAASGYAANLVYEAYRDEVSEGPKPIMYKGKVHYLGRGYIWDEEGNKVDEVGLATPVFDPLDVIPTVSASRLAHKALARRNIVEGAVQKIGVKSEKSIRPVGDLLQSVQDVFKNPKLVKGKMPAEVETALKGTPGWEIEKLGKGRNKGQGWIFRHYTPSGQPSGKMLQWHPGGGRHGPSPYWKVNNGTGPVRIGPQFD